jgi:hypothetical protein
MPWETAAVCSAFWVHNNFHQLHSIHFGIGLSHPWYFPVERVCYIKSPLISKEGAFLTEWIFDGEVLWLRHTRQRSSLQF